MSGRIKDSERTSLIAEFIRTGKSPEGFEIVECKDGKYRVRRIKLHKEILEQKRERLKKQLESIEIELNKPETNEIQNKEEKTEEKIEESN